MLDPKTGDYQTAVHEIIRAKPSAAKGSYIQSLSVSTTMGPNVRIDPAHPKGAEVVTPAWPNAARLTIAAVGPTSARCLTTQDYASNARHKSGWELGPPLA